MSIKEKMQDLQFYVNRIFVTHNLSSNSGVIATVLDEAQEQVRGWGRGVCCWAQTGCAAHIAKAANDVGKGARARSRLWRLREDVVCTCPILLPCLGAQVAAFYVLVQ